ncbi:MAG: hypothetical protein M3R47_14460 [Chloroflexota bacterium]|nr:hypothetical protein [Chloroflexota bacterium]
MKTSPSISVIATFSLLLTVFLEGCGGGGSGSSGDDSSRSNGRGDVKSGEQVFRFETFGNERFWTDAVRLPQGIIEKNFTPLDALDNGISVDADALDQATADTISAELKTDLSPQNAPLLNDVNTTVKLLNANAIIGAVAKDSNGDGTIDIKNGDKIGFSCAGCHTVTDGSVFSKPGGGSIGHRLDGLAAHNFNFGKTIALGQNSKAFFPVLQLSLKANGGKTLGRAPQGLSARSSEADVDAYLSNPNYYPVGMFDDTFDGNGDPMHNMPLFRQDLSAPYGSDATIAKLDNFGNLVYTGLLDPTTVTTPGGRAFLHKLGGAAGDEIADEYVKVLAETGVTGYPFVEATAHSNPGSEEAPLGIRVDNQKLLDMNAYLQDLEAPVGQPINEIDTQNGRTIFEASCTSCHNSSQGEAVPSNIIPMKQIFPGDNPQTLAVREPPLNPVLNSPGTFDDKMAVVNASLRGLERGVALPLLLDLGRKPVFLHDNSVPSLEALFDPVRGANAPHPFFISDEAERIALVQFLKSLDTNQ